MAVSGIAIQWPSMIKRAAIFLLTCAACLSAMAHESLTPATDSPALPQALHTKGLHREDTLDQQTVGRLAAANSAAAHLLQSERTAFAAAVVRSDRSQCRQLNLVDNVTRDLACHERQRAAAQAQTLFVQLDAAKQQSTLLDQSDAVAAKVLRLATKAEELELQNGDRFGADRAGIEKQRLTIADQQAELAVAMLKLRLSLSDLIGDPSHHFLNPTALSRSDPLASLAVDECVAVALVRRCDLKAIESLCGSLNADTLPLVKQSLALLQPGIGLTLAIAARRSLISLHTDDTSAAEICHRREQCQTLQHEQRSQIERQVRVAFAERGTALVRLEIARQQLAIDDSSLGQVRKEIPLDQAKPGSDLIAEIEQLRSAGLVVLRKAALGTAEISLREATGTVLDDEM